MNLEQFKKEITDVFKARKFYQRENTEYQKRLINYFQEKKVEYYLANDSRNYEHSISVLLAFNKNGEIPQPSYYSDLSTQTSIENKFHNTVFVADLTISDITAVYYVNWFRVDCRSSVRGISESITMSELSEEILSAFKIIQVQVEINAKIIRLENELLDTKVDWLKDLEDYQCSDYTPTFRELLFGGLDIYNRLNL